jgi:hypothetical protein
VGRIEREKAESTQTPLVELEGEMMPITYPGLRRHEKQFQHLSGLRVAEFDELYRRFEPAWLQAESVRLQQRQRQRAIGGGNDYQLDLDTRLLLVLIWLRHYLTGEALGYFFGVSQSTASRIISRLLPVLAEVEEKEILPPTGKRRSLVVFEREQPDLFAIFDATEQSVQKPQDDAQSLAHFSGKQRRSTCKTTIHVNEEGLIRQLSPTCPGAVPDVTHLRQSGLLHHLDPETVAVADSAFLGIYKDLPGRNVLVPYKAQRNHPLCAEQRYANRFLASIRIKVENVFAHLKIFRILSHRFRHNVSQVHSQVFTIIAGLHNRRTRNRLKQAWLAT